MLDYSCLHLNSSFKCTAGNLSQSMQMMQTKLVFDIALSTSITSAEVCNGSTPSVLCLALQPLKVQVFQQHVGLLIEQCICITLGGAELSGHAQLVALATHGAAAFLADRRAGLCHHLISVFIICMSHSCYGWSAKPAIWNAEHKGVTYL